MAALARTRACAPVQVVGGCRVRTAALESDDVGGAPLVLGVADATLTRRHRGGAAVEAGLRADIRGDVGVVVTVEAERALRLALERSVALRAFRLELGVRLRERAWHHQLLEGLRRAAEQPTRANARRRTQYRCGDHWIAV
jgi:hypothetical protein